MSKFSKWSFASLMLVMLGLSACAHHAPPVDQPRQPSSWVPMPSDDHYHASRSMPAWDKTPYK